MAVTEVMHNPNQADIPDRQEQRILSRGGPCLVCGAWIEPEAKDAYRLLVSNPPRQAEYTCHEACFEGVKHTALPSPS
jgi:hypothetical protein